MKKLRLFLTVILMILVFGCISGLSATAEEVRDDSAYIQGLIDSASAGSNGIRVVTVPKVNPNDPKGGSVYTLSHAIEIPSNTTVKLDNCTLRLNDGVLCNIFVSKGCYDTSMTSAQELRNISIIGIGNAVLDGGVHNGVTEKNCTSPDGFSTVRYNTSIHFRNVNGFTVSGITVKEPRYWGMTFIYCRYGTITDINFDCSNEAPNQDGIDLRLGCNNITISDITGTTGDDVVALTALSGASDTRFKVQGKDSDIHDVTITDVKASCKGGHGIIRLLCHNGNKVYNVDIKNVEDTGTNHVYGVIRIGDNNYAGSGTAMKYGDIHSVTVDGVISNGKIAIDAPNINVTTAHVTFKNVTVKYSAGILTNLTDDNLEKQPLKPLSGCTVYAFEGGSTEGWIYNNNDLRVSSGTMNGKSDAYTMWPLGKTRLDEGEYLELITAIDGDTSVYEHFRLQLTMAHIAGNDPDPGLMKIYYSTDNGVTWSEETIDLALAYHGDIWVASASSKYNVWSFTSGDLASITDQRITNLMLHPYGEDGSITSGAFRLISLTVVGDHVAEHREAVAATCNSSGKKEHWECTVCGVKFADEACTTQLNGLSLPYDKINGHSLAAVERVEPTETETGCLEHWACSRCGALYADAEAKNKTTFQELTIPVLDPEPDVDAGSDGGEADGDETPDIGEKPDEGGESGEEGGSLVPVIIGVAVFVVLAAAVLTVVLKKRK